MNALAASAMNGKSALESATSSTDGVPASTTASSGAARLHASSPDGVDDAVRGVRRTLSAKDGAPEREGDLRPTREGAVLAREAPSPGKDDAVRSTRDTVRTLRGASFAIRTGVPLSWRSVQSADRRGTRRSRAPLATDRASMKGKAVKPRGPGRLKGGGFAKMMPEEANMISEEANMILDEAKTISEEANMISEEANMISKEANMISEEANMISEEVVMTERGPIRFGATLIFYRGSLSPVPHVGPRLSRRVPRLIARTE
jgi:hypothetical protein